AAVLAVTALVLGAGTAYLVGRYVDDETTSFTQNAVASHFGSVFSDDVFQRGLSADERQELLTVVTFHFSIYNVVATEFFDRTGTIAFSYDSDEIGRKLDQSTYPELASALNGMRAADRTTIVADPKLGVPGSAVGYGSFNTHHLVKDPADASAATPGPGTREIRALEAALALRERTYDATLTALTSALDFRDNETGGHSDRVVAYMELLLEHMHIKGAAELATLRRGALLHDIGKIGVPDNVLRKPTALSESEWAVMKRHPEFGARIISGIPFLEDV